MGLLALRPGDLLTILKMALSIGFRSFSFLPSCYPSFGFLTLIPVGLSPLSMPASAGHAVSQIQSHRQTVLIGAGAPFGFRRLDFADQRIALFGKYGRRILQFGEIALRFGDACFQRGDLIARAIPALQPTVFIGCELIEPAVGEFGLAHDRLLLGAHFG